MIHAINDSMHYPFRAMPHSSSSAYMLSCQMINVLLRNIAHQHGPGQGSIHVSVHRHHHLVGQSISQTGLC
ncbi:hypothetical protein B0T26DRAFT_257075 [Lasiosphaeria miniovina]|uniref:Uncharacterized protein n=1 Tax=Lasiosphaeria miniovina TaxID=1954250 RepID=A0AA40AWH4_9PEZI|nr:uncharacterized protein B0T26DRAFT_257075 [Lasiosphaeria miniovina]KAK0723264.1 hypothetical protein B0T26DRAFT_257075 [Lasiosphaeria miniovina]